MTGTLHEDQCTFMIIPRSILLIMRNVSDENYREIQNTHFMFSNSFRKFVPFMRYVDKCGRAGEATDDMAHAHCMLHN